MTDTTLTPGDPNDGLVEKRLKARCRRVADDFYPALLSIALERIALLPRGAVYKSQGIYGDEFWRQLDDNRLRRLVGEVLANFVCKGKVPLVFASCQYCTRKRYRHL